MPSLTLPDTSLYYDDSLGEGPPIVFSHGLLWSGRMFAPQIDALRSQYRCVAYDHRGQGRSGPSPLRTIDIETVTADAVALIEKLQLAPAHFVGLSMGGFVGMRIAARRPELLRSLVLLETSADPEPRENVPRYRLLNFIARYVGLRPVAKPVMNIMFGQSFLRDPARAAECAEWQAQLIGNRRDIWRAVNGVIERRGVYDELSRVSVPTLIVVGEGDVATVPAKAERIHQAIAGSKLIRIPRAGHTATIEEPALINQALSEFLAHVSA